MQVLAINGSPRGQRGNTARILEPFVEGMREQGAEVELIAAKGLRIERCTGELLCWGRHPGACHIQDDMQALYPKLRAAEVLVLATPVYIPLPGAMQDLMNRLCPLLEPELVFRKGRTRARFREEVRIQRIVLVASSGWWEKENMDTVLRIAQELAEDASVEFSGALLRPHAFAMRKEGELTEGGRAVQEAARQAGRELVREGCMRPETLALVSRPLISEEERREAYNWAP